MAAPAFVSATAHAGNPTTAPSITLPTTAANDILILVGVNAGATTAITPGGTYNGGAWTLIDGGTWTTGWGGCFWSRATGNHTGQTVTGSTTDSGSMGVIRISGAVTVGSPIDINVAGASVAATNGSLTGFNTTVADTLVVLTAATDDNQTKSAFTKNAVTMSNLSLAASTGGGDSGIGYANASQASTGATGNFAITEAAGTAQGKRLSGFAIIPDGAEINDSSPANHDAVNHGLSTDTAPTLPSGWSANVGSLSNLAQFLEVTYGLTGTTGTGITTNYNPFTNSTVRSFGGWAKRTDTSATHVLTGSTGSGLVPQIQLASGSQDVVFAPSIFSTTTTWSSAWPGNGTWYFWGITFDESSDAVRLYINGRLVSQESLATAWGGTNNLLTWGAGGPTLASAFKGSISNMFAVEGTVTPSQWAWLAGNRYDRTADLSAATSITTSGEVESSATTYERSAALSAATDIASSGTFWTTLERSAAISAATSIASTFARDHLRSAALTAASSIASQASFYSILERSAAISAATGIASAPQRDHIRSVGISAATFIDTTGNVEGQPSVYERSASLSATTAVTASGLKVTLRSASLTATTAISSVGRRTLIRSAAITATTAVSAAGEFETPSAAHQRSASLSASTSISTSALPVRIRSASLSASTSVQTAHHRELLRAAALEAATSLTAASQRELLRSVVISAVTLIDARGGKYEAWTYGADTTSTYGPHPGFTYAGGTTSTYGADADWTYGGTASLIATYGG